MSIQLVFISGIWLEKTFSNCNKMQVYCGIKCTWVNPCTRIANVVVWNLCTHVQFCFRDSWHRGVSVSRQLDSLQWPLLLLQFNTNNLGWCWGNLGSLDSVQNVLFLSWNVRFLHVCLPVELLSVSKWTPCICRQCWRIWRNSTTSEVCDRSSSRMAGRLCFNNGMLLITWPKSKSP